MIIMGWDDETWSQRQRELEDSCRIFSFFLGADLAKANDSTKTLSYKQISPKTRQPSAVSWSLPVAFCMLLLENETCILRNEAQIGLIPDMIYIFL